MAVPEHQEDMGHPTWEVEVPEHQEEHLEEMDHLTCTVHLVEVEARRLSSLEEEVNLHKPHGGSSDQLAMWANYADPSHWDPSRWQINAKVSDDLKSNPFDGVTSKYKEWNANVINHLLQSNQGWGKVIWLIRRPKSQ